MTLRDTMGLLDNTGRLGGLDDIGSQEVAQHGQGQSVRPGWKYVSAWFGAKVDEKADPKIQIQQAIQEAQRQHEALTRQAATVIGNQRQLEMQLDRQLGQIEKLQAQARQALVLADKARAEGDEAKAAEFEQTAQALANQLVSAEQSVQDLKELHDQSLQAAAAGPRGGAEQRADAAGEAGRADQAAQPAGAGQDAGAGLGLAAADERDGRARRTSRPWTRCATRSSAATPSRSARPTWPRTSTGGRMLEVKRATIDLKGPARLDEIRASLAAEKQPTAIGGDRRRRRLRRGSPGARGRAAAAQGEPAG